MPTMSDFSRINEIKGWTKQMREQAAVAKVDEGKYVQKEIEKLVAEKKLDPTRFAYRAAFEAIVNPEGMLDTENAADVCKAVEASLLPRVTQPLVTAMVKDAYDYEMGNLLSAFTEEDANHSQTEEVVGINPFGDLQYRKPGDKYERAGLSDESYKYLYKDYGLILDITMEELMDDKNNLIVKKSSAGGEAQGRKLAKLLCQTIEMTVSRSEFGEGTNGNTAYTRNGVSHFSHSTGSSAITGASYPFYATVTHAGIDNQVNINSIGDDFGTDGVMNANKALQRMTDNKGSKIAIRPTAIIANSIMWEVITRFLNSNGLYDTMEPSINAWKGMGLRLLTSPYFASEARWFFGAPEKAGRVRWVERPNTISMTGLTKDAFESRIAMSYRHNMYLGVGWLDYRYLVSAGVTP